MKFDLHAAVRDTEGLVNVPPGRHELDEPLVLPDRPMVIRGAGMALTTIACIGRADAWIDGRRSNLWGPHEIHDFTMTADVPKAGKAVDVSYPEIAACHDPTFIASRIRLRCAAPDAAFTQGLVARGCWSPLIGPVWIQGRNADQTVESLDNAVMECAIDLTDAQEGKVLYPQIACCTVGVKVSAPKQGKGEGLHVSHGAFTNVKDGVLADGGNYGGNKVPWLHVNGNHFFYTRSGVLSIGRGGVVLSANNFCGAHYTHADHVGAYMVNSDHVQIVGGNEFWTTRPGGVSGYAVVVDGGRDGVFSGNTVRSTLRTGIWLNPKAGGNWITSGNSNNAKDPVADQRKAA